MTYTLTDIQEFLVQMTEMKARAMQLGMYKTGHAMDVGTRAAGYELAEIMEGKHPTRIDENGNLLIVGKVKPG